MLTSGEYNAGSYVLFFLKVYVNASTEQRWTKSKSKEQFSHNRKLITKEIGLDKPRVTRLRCSMDF